jgi:predicted phosphodiesterase
MNLDALKNPGKSGSDRRDVVVPESWRPRSEIGSDGGYAISTPRLAGNLPSAEEILSEHGLNPAEWIVTSARHGRWQRWDGEWLESSRINIAPATVITYDYDLEALVDEIKKWKPSKGSKAYGGGGAYVHNGADKQLGKKASSGGTDQTVRRLLQATEGSLQRLTGLRKAGLQLGTVVLTELGDHVEGNVSQQGRLQGQAASDLGQTEQVRVARRLLLAQIKAFAPHAEKIIVPVVNGNHDEVTRQVMADPADGWNVEIASAVQDACAENPDLGNVEFRFPQSGHQTLTVDINGTMLGLFHGHQFSRDVEKYLSGQMLGQTALGGADVWVSGHYHHFKTADIGSRLWLQCPTTDPGSDWFRDRAGANSKPGVLTFVIGGDYDPREHIGVVPVD